MISHYGHVQFRTPEYMQFVTKLQLPNCNINTANVSSLPMLQLLDLSNNYINLVNGLDKLVQYEFAFRRLC